MRFYFVSCLLLFCFFTSAQTSYKCVYADTVTMTLSAGMLNNFNVNINGAVPDSVKQKIESQLKKQILMRPMVQLRERQVVATADSTVVTYDQNKIINVGLTMNLPYTKMVMRKGKIDAMYDANGTVLLPENEERKFTATGKEQQLLNYICAEYKNSTGNGSITIWVTSALPSFINPGVKNVDVAGGILSFSIESENSTIVSTVQSINKLN